MDAASWNSELLITVQVRHICCVFLIQLMCLIANGKLDGWNFKEIIKEKCYIDVRIKCSMAQENPRGLLIEVLLSVFRDY
jgi:hypothetical protein